jgi:hypothetical protein
MAARIARQFHFTYERLAPRFGYETRPETAVPWEDLPDENRKLMIAVVVDLLAAGKIGYPPGTGGECQVTNTEGDSL